MWKDSMTMLQHEIVKTPPAIPSSNRLDSSPTRRIPSLDGLRAISVGFVIFGHMAECGQAPRFLERYANFGVQVFFIISGYLITTLLLKERLRKGSIDLKAFYIRRVLRIFPAAYVFIAVAVVVFRPHLRDVIIALTYVSNFNATRPWELGHLWSLAVEEQFYLLWPATMVLFFARSRLILISVVAVVPLANIALHFAHLSSLIGTAFPSVADSLALGCLAAFFPTVNLKNKIFAWSGPLTLLIQSIPIPSHLAA